MLTSKCRWWCHWIWLPVLISGSPPMTLPQDETMDLLGGPLPVDSSSALDEDLGDVGDLPVNASASRTDGIGAVHEKVQNTSSIVPSSATISQFLGDKNGSSISITSGAKEAPQVSDAGGESDHHDVEDAEHSSNQSSSNSSQYSSSGTVMEQLLRVQLSALRQENEALHAAMSHSAASAASLDKELANAENKRAEAEAAQHAATDQAQKEHDEVDAMVKKFSASERQHVVQLKEMQSEKHSLEVNLSTTQNQTVELQNRLQEAVATGKVALSAAEKQEASLTAGLQKARAGEDKYHKKASALAKSVDQLRQVNARLRKSLRLHAQQLHKSETLRLRAEGALDNAEKEVTQVSKRTGSEQWFEEQVAALRAAQQNATRDAKFSREARDAEQSLLDEANRDRKNLTAKLVALNRSDEQRIHFLSAALSESKAQTQKAESDASNAQQMVAHLRSDLKNAEHRREGIEAAAQESANRSTIVKQFADTEVQRAQKEAEDADLAAGKAVTRAARAESQVASLRQDLQGVKTERDELKASQRQEMQSAQDLAAEVERLKNKLADSKSQLSRSEQHAATLQAQFDAVGDLGVQKISAGKSHASESKKPKKQHSSTKNRMKLSLSLLERANTDAANVASSQTPEKEEKDESQKRSAMMKSDADRLNALLS